MTPLTKLVKRAWEKLRGVYYEGPEPPDRISQMVVVFAESYPHATRKNWVEFAQAHAREAYRTAYMRGVEWSDRDLARREWDLTPEEMMLVFDPDFEWLNHPVDLRDPDAVVLDRETRDPRAEYRQHALEVETHERQRRMGQGRGGEG